MAVGAAIPGFGLAAQCCDIRDSAFSEALAAEEANLNLGLVLPASMLGGVVDGKALPQPSAVRFAEAVHQRLAGMGAQVIHDQMNGVGSGIVLGDAQQKIGKLGRRAGGRHFGEMDPCLGLDAAKDIGRAATLVLIIPSCDLPELHGN